MASGVGGNKSGSIKAKRFQDLQLSKFFLNLDARQIQFLLESGDLHYLQQRRTTMKRSEVEEHIQKFLETANMDELIRIFNKCCYLEMERRSED